MFDLKEIVIMCREKGREKFKEKAKYTNIDEGKCMITFISYTENVRKINDWGREEDKDVHIGLDENGWICYYQTNQNGAGDFEIIDENTTAVSDDYIVNYLQGEKCTNDNYLQFMKNAYDICYLY